MRMALRGQARTQSPQARQAAGSGMGGVIWCLLVEQLGGAGQGRGTDASGTSLRAADAVIDQGQLAGNVHRSGFLEADGF